MDTFYFMRDDDAHWYMVPAVEREAFKNWINDGERSDYQSDLFNENFEHFDNMRCEHPSLYEVSIIREI